MTQLELENQIKALVGYKHHYLRAEDFRNFDAQGKPIAGTGKVQIYALWLEVGGVIKLHRLDVLVLKKGTAQETAEPYVSLSDFEPIATPFKDELISKLPAYQSAHPEVEKVTIDSCNEANRIAIVTAYEYDNNADVTNQTKKIVYEVGGVLTVRNLNAGG